MEATYRHRWRPSSSIVLYIASNGFSSGIRRAVAPQVATRQQDHLRGMKVLHAWGRGRQNQSFMYRRSEGEQHTRSNTAASPGKYLLLCLRLRHHGSSPNQGTGPPFGSVSKSIRGPVRAAHSHQVLVWYGQRVVHHMFVGRDNPELAGRSPGPPRHRRVPVRLQS
jgi:hypothetical protein